MPTAKDRALVAMRVALLLLVVLAPWPFGSVTPFFSALLTTALTLLAGSVLALELGSGGWLAAPPAWRWLAAAGLLLTLQQVHWPASLVGVAAPGVEAAHAAADVALEREGEASFRPLTVEPFQTRWTSLELLGFVFAFYLSYLLFAGSGPRQMLAYAIAATGVVLSLFAVYQNARFGTVLYGRFPTESGMPFGPFVNHNHFAGYVEAAALVTLGVAVKMAWRHGSLAFLLFGAATLMGIAHVLSQSRGGVLAAAAGLFALFWISDAKRHRGHVVAAGLGVLVFLLAVSPGSLVDRWTGLGDGDDSVRFRTQLWSDSLRLAGASPLLGTGLGTYAAVIPAHRTGPDETRAEFAESDWVQYLCETGIAGIALALGLLTTVLLAGRRAIGAEPSRRSRGVREGAFAAVVALAVHGLFDFNLHIPSNALLFAVLAGLLVPRRGDGLAIERRPLRVGIAAVSLALAAAIGIYVLELGASRELERRVDPVLTDPSELAGKIRTLVVSRERVPLNPGTAFLLGRLYNEEAYRALGHDRYRDIRLGQARAAFREALALAPARGRYWFELAWTEANRGNHDIADRLFPRALELEPHWANLRANYALYLVAMGRVDEALDQVVIARALEPGLDPLDALSIVGPYLEGDTKRLRRAAGEGEDAETALAAFRRSEVP